MLKGCLGSHSVPLIEDDNVARILKDQSKLVSVSPIPQYLKHWVRGLVYYGGSLKVPKVKYPHLSVLPACCEIVDVASKRDRVYLAVVRNELLHNGLSVQVPH